MTTSHPGNVAYIIILQAATSLLQFVPSRVTDSPHVQPFLSTGQKVSWQCAAKSVRPEARGKTPQKPCFSLPQPTAQARRVRKHGKVRTSLPKLLPCSHCPFPPAASQNSNRRMPGFSPTQPPWNAKANSAPSYAKQSSQSPLTITAPSRPRLLSLIHFPTNPLLTSDSWYVPVLSFASH